MLRTHLYILLFLAAFSNVYCVCSDGCECKHRTMSCLRLDLEQVPHILNGTHTLDLSHNRIVNISRGSTYKVHEDLTILLLNDNRITTLKRGVFEGLPNLKHLYLQRNRIRHIDAEAFNGLKHLLDLYMHYNEITSIEVGSFLNLPSLKRLRLDSNPLNCDCEIIWMAEWITNVSYVELTATCHTPVSLTGISLVSLSKEELNCEKPNIVKEPKDAVVPYGSDVIFDCMVTGNPAPEVIWVRDSSQLTDNSRYTMLDNGTLVIKKLDMSDDGYFECIAVNSIGKVKSRPARMIVKLQSDSTEAPYFIQKPQDVRVSAGETRAIVNCLVKGNPKPHVHWYFNNQRMLLTERHKVLTNGSVVIKNPRIEDGGMYTCHGINVLGKVTASATVLISSPPEFLIVPENKTASLGERVNFICKARGIPNPIVAWYKNSELLEPSSNIVFNQDYTVLTFEEITENDEDIYQCTAENEDGFIETVFKVNLDSEIRSKPKIIHKPFDIEANVGTSVEIPCKSNGDPKPRIEWKKEGSTVLTNSKTKVSLIGSLMIYNLSVTDSGRYECSVINELGRDTASAVLYVVGLLPGDQYVRSAVKQAMTEIDQAINNTIEALINKSTHVDPFRAARYPDSPARAVARSAEIYERALALIKRKVSDGMKIESLSNFEFRDILSPDQIDTIAVLSGCTAHRAVNNCSDVCYHNRYRSIDGTCNNFKHNTWGASLTGFRRILKPIYENGFSLPVGWNKDVKYNGYTLPSARKISIELISTKQITEDKNITHMVMQWGQFLDHDLDHALPSVSSQSWDGIDCKKSCEFAPPCFPMEVPSDDPRVTNRRCIDFIRTSAVCGSGMTSIFFNELQTREQVNQLTSFIDASQVYGFSKELANDLRDLSTNDGNLRVGPTFEGRKPVLPFAGNQGVDCRRDPLESNVNCFVAGDIRANEQIGLTAMHTIWMREHNRLTNALKLINPFWDGEVLYQEARKIIGAQMQFITYEKWLPIILGPEGMKMLGSYKEYDSNLNPSISNVFATAALRFGHTLINPILHRYDENFEPIPQGHLELHKAFFAPWRIIEEGGVDPLIRGMFITPAKIKKPDQNLNDELTEKLFHTAHAVALDLAAMNVQRSRDHAIPPYVEWRQFCNMSEVTSFDDLKNEISDPIIRKKLKELYGNPKNIDVFVGGILEDQVYGGKVGPLIRCLLIEQFIRLRDGDRLWYENPTTFKPQQLAQIKETNLARIICDNADNIDTISEDLFILPELQEGLLDCEDIPSIDLRFWADCHNCEDNFLDNKRKRRSVSEPEELGISGLTTQLLQLQNKFFDIEKEMERMKNRLKLLELKELNLTDIGN